MFDIGFWELALIGLVTLIVVGPQRLPGVVRHAGFWLGKTRRMVASVKQELKEELYAEDMRQSLLEKPGRDEIRDFMQDVNRSLDNPAGPISRARVPEENTSTRDAEIQSSSDQRDGKSG